MTTRYRVEYALKTHRRDQFIEWIKGLLAVPFVLHSQPTAIYDGGQYDLDQMARTAKDRYGEIMKDVERLVREHIAHHRESKASVSKLKLLVPSIGTFFTPLHLNDAFHYQDSVRRISSRRFVPPSFNDVRAILNTAQVMSLVKDTGRIELMTFDGDVTLYDDGESLQPENPAIPRLLSLLKRGIKVGLVTAAGYLDAIKYYDRLHGLLDAVHNAEDLGDNKKNLIVMGGEANYLFKYSDTFPYLEKVPREEWALEEMKDWTEENITELLNTAEGALIECVKTLNLHGQVLRKDRAVGVYPATPGYKFPRELLEETVLVVQKVLEMSDAGQRIPFCAFNGGNDVFVDIGDKSWGVLITQKYFGGIEGGKTIHVGDQFLSAGANDFKARLACTTAWIASPAETVSLLDEIESFTVGSSKSNGHVNGNGHTISNQESKPDTAASADAAARDLLDAPAIPADKNTSSKDDTPAYAPSTYDADESSTADDETASTRSSGTAVPQSSDHPFSVNGSSISGNSPKSTVPDSLADRTAWMNISKGKLHKYAHKYARKEPEAGGGSVLGENESVAGDGSVVGDSESVAGGVETVEEPATEVETW